MGIKKAPYIRSPIDPKTMADQQGTIPSFLGVFIVIFDGWKTNLLNELVSPYLTNIKKKIFCQAVFPFFCFFSKNTWQNFLNIIFCLRWRRQYYHNLFSQIIAIMNVPMIMIQRVSSKCNCKRFNAFIWRQPFGLAAFFWHRGQVGKAVDCLTQRSFKRIH